MSTPETETAPASPIDQVLDRLQAIEARLNGLLAAGWRNAGDDLDELAAEATALADLGLSEAAARLQALATAASPGEGVRAAGLALAACRLLRLRLAPDLPPAGDWAPFAPGKRQTPSTRLLPLARFALADREVWSCLWFKGGYTPEWVLIEPPNLPGSNADRTAPWLTRTISGRLRWRARMPVGAAGEVEVCALENAAWTPPPEDGTPAHPLDSFVQSIRRGRPGENVWFPGDRLKLVPFDPGDASAYAWPDPAAPAVLASAAATVKDGWALLWTVGGATPIALISVPPPRTGLGALRDALKSRLAPRIVHLVPGLPSDAMLEI